MKKHPLSLSPLALLSVVCAARLHAGSATWNGTDSDWSISGNWTPATVPGTGDTATFGAGGSPAVAPVGVTVKNLSFTAAAQAYAFSGFLTVDAGGTLSIAGNSAAQTLAAVFTFSGDGSVINNADPANVAAFSAGIALPLAAGSTFTFDGTGATTVTTVNSGAASGSVLTKLVKSGTGSAALLNSNTGFGGTANGDGITINAGTLRIGNQNGAGNRVINLNGGTLECSAGNANSQYTRLHVSADSRLFYSNASNQWQVGNSSTGVMVSTGTPVLTLDGTVSGTTATPIRLNLNTTAFTGTWALTNKAVVRLANASTGGAGLTIDLGTGSGTHVVESLATFHDTAALAIKPIVIGALTSTSADAVLRGRQNTGTQTTGTQYRIGALGTDTTYSGIIADGTAANGTADGTGAVQTGGASGSQATTEIVKVGSGTLTLTGAANTYTGGTVITEGTLAIAGDGSLGAAWDGSLRPFSMIPGVGTFTALPTVTLAGGGGSGAVLTLFSSTSQPTTANTYYLAFGSSPLINNQTGSGYFTNPSVTVNVAGTSPASSASVRVKGLLTLDGGTLRTDAAVSSGRAVVLASGGTVNTNGFDSNFSGIVSGGGGLTKTGAGTLALGNAVYAGATRVEAGRLMLNGALSSAITVSAGAVLGGTASTSGAVTVNGTLSPGASLGSISTGALTLAGGSAFAFEAGDWNGAAGTGYDSVTAASLEITATSATPVTVNVSELALANFDGTSKSFVLVSTTGGITGFATDRFTVNSAGFTSGAGPWSIGVSGNNLVLNYTGAASPYDTWAAGFGLAGADAQKSADPDKDGVSNVAEFGFNSNPVIGSAPGGPNDGGIRPVAGGNALTLTIRVRTGAAFAGAGTLTATKDGVTYRIEGSTDLSAWTADIDEVTPALAAGLPAPDPGWEYRTFRFAAAVSSTARAQIRARAGE